MKAADTETTLPPVLERDYPLLLNDVGPDAELRSWLYFDFMQDIAARHAELLGVGMSSLRELGIIWVLSRMKLQIMGHPVYGDTLHIRTWPSGFQKLFATRQYEAYSRQTGQMVACASSYWLTLDASTMRPIPPMKTVNGLLPENPGKPFYFPDLKKMNPAGEADFTEQTAGQSVIDYNNHWNNAVYVRCIQDWLAARKHACVKLREIQIQYNHPVKFGETLRCGGVLNEDSSFSVSGSVNGISVFCSEGTVSGEYAGE